MARFKITLHARDAEAKSGRSKLGKTVVIEADTVLDALESATTKIGGIPTEHLGNVVRVLVEEDQSAPDDGFGIE